MKKTDYKNIYREYEHIYASPELKKRILSAIDHNPERTGSAKKIVITASVAAAVLTAALVICAVSLFSQNPVSDSTIQMVQEEAANDLSEVIKTASASPENPADEVSKITTAPEEESTEEKEPPALVLSDGIGLILKDTEEGAGNIADPTPILSGQEETLTDNDIFSQEPAYDSIDEQPVMRAVDAGTYYDDLFTESAVPDEAIPDTFIEDVASVIYDDSQDQITIEIVSPTGPDEFDPENPDWSLLKDHDTFVPTVDYDPMLFTDKERPVYESCDHEWVTSYWPDGSEFTECSKCHVHLNMWLYNGYQP